MFVIIIIIVLILIIIVKLLLLLSSALSLSESILARSFISLSPYRSVSLSLSLSMAICPDLVMYLSNRLNVLSLGCLSSGSSTHQVPTRLWLWHCKEETTLGYPNTNRTLKKTLLFLTTPFGSFLGCWRIFLVDAGHHFLPSSLAHTGPMSPWLHDLRRRSLHDTELHAVGDQLPSIAVVFYVPWKTQLVRPMVSPMAGPEIKNPLTQRSWSRAMMSFYQNGGTGLATEIIW